MKKNIIIGYTNSKSEEKRVAFELFNYYSNTKDFNVEIIDFSSCFDADKNFRKILFKKRLVSKTSLKLSDSNVKKYLKDFNPDLVVSTNYCIDYLISYYNNINLIKTKVISILCEISLDYFNSHLSNADYYIVNNKVMKNKLLKKNINSRRIIVAGTPTFSIDNLDIEEKELTLRKYSLETNKPIYLMIANGYDYIYEYFKVLAKKNFDIYIVLISGKNKSLMNKCEDYVFENNIKNVLIFGYIKEIYNLFNISDVIITKPGTSTLIECMNFKKPSILLPGLSIEERKNLKFMVKNHLSFKATTPLDLVKKVRISLNYKFITNSIQNRLRKLNNYDSCEIIYDLSKKLLKK